MSKGFALIVTLLLFIGVSSIVFEADRAEASGTVYIKADGSVDPSTAPIKRDGDIYTITDHIYGEIVVERSNILIDGNACTLQGSGYPSTGIYLFDVSNVTIKNSNIQGFRIGIHLNSTSHNVLCGNNMKNNDFAVWLDYSSNNTVSRNNMKNNDNGIWLAYSQKNIIYGNGITANTCLGIGFAHCSNNTVSANEIKSNYEGIYLDRSSNNVLAENNITANSLLGIWHYRSLKNIISGNNIKNNYMGVSLWDSSNNTASGNNIIANNAYGIHLENVHDNKFCHNNFIDNPQHVHILEPGHVNSWDNSIEGNYWSDYVGVDSNRDGIGDSPHVLDECNKDNHPLMGRFSSFNTSLGYAVNVISNSTIENLDCFEFNGTIKMYVSGKEEYGFCRVIIPYVLMNVNNISVIIDDGVTLVLYYNYTLHDNDTHRWIYFAYENSTHEIDILLEFPSPIILPLLVVGTLLIALIYRRELSKCS